MQHGEPNRAKWDLDKTAVLPSVDPPSTPKEDPPSIPPPFYESGLFWGAFTTAIAIVLVVVAARIKDLRWLLWLSWPFFCLGTWAACRYIRKASYKWVTMLLICVAIGIGLLWGYKKLSSDDLLIRIEPEHGILVSTTGTFTLSAVNDGSDIDHIWVTRDYFIAQKDGRSINIKNILRLECGPDHAADVLPLEFKPSPDFEGTIDGSASPVSVTQAGSPINTILRTNQQFPISITHSGWVTLAYKIAKSSFHGKSLLGIRIILAFRRFSDQKEVKSVRVFEISEDSQPGSWSLSAPHALRMKRPSDAFMIEDVLPYAESTNRWSGLLVHYKNGKPVSVD